MKTLNILFIIIIAINTTQAQNEGIIDFAAQIEATGDASVWPNIVSRIVTVDDNDFIYHYGTFNDSIVFGDSVLHCTNQRDAFLCKADTNNIIYWEKHFICNEQIFYFDSYYDSDEGIIFIFGSFYGSIVIDNNTLTSNGPSDMFIAKLDMDGNYLQVLQMGGDQEDNIICLTKDKEGNIIIGGSYYQSTVIGDSVFNSPSGFGDETFTAKFNYELNFIWAIKGTGHNTDQVNECVTDTESNIYISGYCYEGITFDTIVLNEPHKDAFIAKISKDGEYLWAKQYGGDSEDCWVYVIDMLADDDGNFYIAGQFKEKIIIGDSIFQCDGLFDIYLLSFDSNGNYKWAKQYGGPEEDVSWALYMDEENNIYFTGGFMDKIVLGNTTLTATGLVDSFISELDENGNFKWAYRIGGTDSYFSRVFCSSLYRRNSSLYLGGIFEKDVVLGDDHFSSNTSFDGFVARYKLVATDIEYMPFAKNSLLVFPNPAKKDIVVQFQLPKPGKVKMYLTDNYGKLLKAFNEGWYLAGLHQHKLDLSEYSPGVYFVQIVSGTSITTEKIILTK